MAHNNGQLIPLSQLELDDRNANRGTDRGRGMLDKSLKENKAGRSILADKHGPMTSGMPPGLPPGPGPKMAGPGVPGLRSPGPAPDELARLLG